MVNESLITSLTEQKTKEAHLLRARKAVRDESPDFPGGEDAAGGLPRGGEAAADEPEDGPPKSGSRPGEEVVAVGLIAIAYRESFSALKMERQQEKLKKRELTRDKCQE
ncbi:UNVERIFIED_CONTAM: hypothetical protein PYX00_009462 [Menopon gallinae]|uniref:Uncharacterized protein n=1 Tax=Menopon gallinae TaxID=328185 RepID=A0AAW2HBB7_9NEOP